MRLAVQRHLERGASQSVLGSMLALGWASFARPARPLVSPVPSLCIGGATLGGSGKTPLAIACARFLAERGLRVALVGHAYRAHPPLEPRRVEADDDPRLVGDEALECARALEGTSASVVVARRRQRAIDGAATFADVLVLDGPLQTAPERATLSLLAVDPTSPWGSGACPPLGDLRAPKAALLAATDRVVPVSGVSRGAYVEGRLVRWEALRTMRVGLATSVARPSRVLAFVRRHGVEPRVVASAADHAPLRLPAESEVDLWLTTAKDAAHPGTERLAVLEYYFVLPQFLEELLLSRFPFRF